MAGISIAVNISARQFRQPDFVGKVLDTLVRTGIRPGTIELELTESLLVDDVDQVVARMSELRAHGLRFSVDDFGVGYSSLSYLKRLPLDTLKIDMSFIKDILVDPGSSAIAQAIISLAHAMDLKVIAEGVESEEQRDYLDRLGCHSCQGYFFGEPVPAAQFEQRMAGPYVPKP
jgi:EAL domain-containing protein (putative c-di-GMP-specific phosphodiesterase class I)